MFSARNGLRAHRVDVGERVRGGDPAPVVRVVDDRREEVERGDQRLAVREPNHRGVVAGVGRDEHVGAELGQREGAEHGLEIGRPELAPAPGAVAEGRESPLLHGSRMPHCRPCEPPSSGTSSGSSSVTSSACRPPATSCTRPTPGRNRAAGARSRPCSSLGWRATAPSTRRSATTNAAPGRGGAWRSSASASRRRPATSRRVVGWCSSTRTANARSRPWANASNPRRPTASPGTSSRASMPSTSPRATPALFERREAHGPSWRRAGSPTCSPGRRASGRRGGQRGRPGRGVRPRRGSPDPPALIVRTEGRRGGRYETADGRSGRYEAVAPPGPVVDTYGAGDSFAAGLTFALGSAWRPNRPCRSPRGVGRGAPPVVGRTGTSSRVRPRT